MNKSLVALILAVAACGGGQKPAPEPTAPTGPTAPAAGSLVLGDASIAIEVDGEKHLLALTADGKVLADDKQIASISADGAMTVDGAVVLRIAADGAITDGEGHALDAKRIVLRDDGTLVENEETILVIGADGALGGKLAETEMKGLRFVVSGAPETRRAIMFAWLGGMASRSEPAPAPPPTSGP